LPWTDGDLQDLPERVLATGKHRPGVALVIVVQGPLGVIRKISQLQFCKREGACKNGCHNWAFSKK